jgi:CRP-like cAMP-binding protein
MLERQSFRAYPETRFASGYRAHARCGPLAPGHNRVLAALPPGEYGRLLPDLEPVSMPLGWTVHDSGEREKYLYFLTAGIVSRCYVTEHGSTAAISMTGSEGVIGVATFLGGMSAPNRASVLSAGHAYRLGMNLVHREFEQPGPLSMLLLRSTQALITQVSQTAACNRHHSVEQQVCRWLLSCLDRMPSNELAMTQETIGDMLGVRREAVTQAAGNLQDAGLIHYKRGQIVILDAPRLEARACECYAVVKREYDRLLPDFRNDGPAGPAWNRQLAA